MGKINVEQIKELILDMLLKENYKTRGFRYITDEGMAYLSGMAESDNLCVIRKDEYNKLKESKYELSNELRTTKEVVNNLQKEINKLNKKRWKFW